MAHRRACEASLRRLQTDHIDLYQRHHIDRATPWEEIWQAMEQLVREGKVSHGRTRPRTAPSRHRVDAHRDQLEAYEELCRELGAKPAHMALAWVLHNPAVSTTVTGATTSEQLRSNLGALSAPQAYAW